MVTSNKEASTAKRMLTKAKRLMDEKLLGMVKDCTTTFGKLFNFSGWKHVELQDCITHVKWIITKHVKGFSKVKFVEEFVEKKDKKEGKETVEKNEAEKKPEKGKVKETDSKTKKIEKKQAEKK